jgi:hypothetical protein
MGSVSLHLIAAPSLRRIGRMTSASKDPMGGDSGRQVIRAIRRSVAQEFSGGYWSTPSGGKRQWKPTKPFGEKAGGRPPLGGSAGRLAAAWAGGAGGFEKITSRTAQVGVRMPGAAVHRGGEGARVALRETRIKAKAIGAKGKPKMYWLLGMKYGVWMSPEKLRTTGIAVPSRPHATRNPALSREITDVIRKKIVEA